jgi:hypothetical protein
MIGHTLCGRIFFTPSLLSKNIIYKNYPFTIYRYNGIFNWKYVESSEKMWAPYYSSDILLINKKNETFLEKLEIRSDDGLTIKSIDVNKKFKNRMRVYDLDDVLETITMNTNLYFNYNKFK